jgi:chloramphenicol-sensitive protein RarD
LAAFGAWGIMPLYFVAMRHVSPFEILSQRIVWSMLLLAALLSIFARWEAVQTCFRQPKSRLLFLASAALLSGNWLIYIYGVATRQTVETSLGYFINPLLNVALGMLIFHERLRPAQKLALALGTLAVTILIVGTGTVPLIALSLAVTFATYGLLRKIAPADAIVGLSIETMLLTPPALAYLAYLGWTRQTHLITGDWTTSILLLSSGVITTFPLLCFGQAARTVPLSMLGFMQFISPSMQFVLAVTVLGEPLSIVKLWAFICIWVGLAIYSIDAWRASRSKTDEFVGEQVVESAAAEA